MQPKIKTFPLQDPIEIDNRLIGAVTVRRPRAGDIAHFEGCKEYQPFIAFQNKAMRIAGLQDRLKKRAEVGKDQDPAGSKIKDEIEQNIDEAMNNLPDIIFVSLALMAVKKLSDIGDHADLLDTHDLLTIWGWLSPFVLSLGQESPTASPGSPGSENGDRAVMT